MRISIVCLVLVALVALVQGLAVKKVTNRDDLPETSNDFRLTKRSASVGNVDNLLHERIKRSWFFKNKKSKGSKSKGSKSKSSKTKGSKGSRRKGSTSPKKTKSKGKHILGLHGGHSKSKITKHVKIGGTLKLRSGSIKSISSTKGSKSPKSRSRSKSANSRSRSKSPKSRKGSTSVKSRKGSTSAKSRKGSTSAKSRSRSKSPKSRSGSKSPKSRKGSKSKKSRTGSKSPKSRSGSESPKSRSGSKSTKSKSGSKSPKSRKSSKSSKSRSGSKSPKSRSKSQKSRKGSKSRRKRKRKAAESTQIKVGKDQAVVDQVKKANEELCQCKVNGDPHFHTYDGQKIDFMGLCTYTLSRSLIQDDECAFNVEVKNHRRKGGKPNVSWVRSVYFTIYGIRIKLHIRRKLYVNGKRAHAPVSLANGKLNIIKSGKSLEAVTACGVRVKFDGIHLVKVKVPKKYAGRMTGICGDCNSQKDDIRLANGTDVTEVKGRFELLGTSYLVPALKGRAECVAVTPSIECSKPTKTLVSRDDSCGLIRKKDGPFARCIEALGSDVMDYFDGCTYDACAYEGSPQDIQDSVCKSLEAFAADCEDAGIIVRWRKADFCALPCADNMVYNPAMSGCQDTCSELPPLDQCPVDLSEGCQCAEGFVMSGDACVPEDNCGCLTDHGFYYPVGTGYTTDDCLITYTCQSTPTGAKLVSHSINPGCAEHATCRLVEDEPVCTCNEGYLGKGNISCSKAAVKMTPTIVEYPIKQEKRVFIMPESNEMKSSDINENKPITVTEPEPEKPNEQEVIVEKPREPEVIVEKPNEPEVIVKKPNEQELIEEKPKEPEVIVEKPNEPEVIVEKPREPEVIVEKAREPEVIVEKPKIPEVIVEKPKEPEVIVEKPKVPEVIVEKPNAPEVIVEKPREPEVIVEKPREPEVIVEKPNAPEVILEKPNEPEVIVEKPDEPEVIVEKTREPEVIVEKKNPPEVIAEKLKEPEVIVEKPKELKFRKRVLEFNPVQQEEVQEIPKSAFSPVAELPPEDENEEEEEEFYMDPVPEEQQPVPVEEPVPEQAVPVEEPVQEQPVPVEEPAPEQPVPVEEPVPEQLVPVEEPVPEQPVPEEEPIPEPEQVPIEEPAPEQPVPVEEPVPEQPVRVEEQAPEQPVPVEEPVPEQPVPVEEPAPEQPVPVEEPVPEQPVPVEEPAPEQLVPVEEPAPEQPVPVEEPAPEQPVPVEEPVPEQPVPVEEPVPEKPVPVEEPVPEPNPVPIEEPVPEQPVPVEEPVPEQPVQVEEPASEQPVPVKEPAPEQPVQVEEPAPEQPVPVEEPVPEQPVPVEEPVPKQPVTVEEPVPEQPVPVEEPAPEQSVPVEEPVPEQPVPVEEPAPEQSVPVEEPAPEQPVPVEEPAPEQPVPVEEPVPEQPVPVEETAPEQPVPAEAPVPTASESQPKPTPELSLRPIKFVPCYCEAKGDPHYTTFDNATIELYAECKYTMSKGQLDDGRCKFDVEVKNQRRPESNHPFRAFTRYVDVQAGDERVQLGQGGVVLFNRVKRSVPFITPEVNVTRDGKFVLLTTRCGVEVRFDGRFLARVKTPPSYRNRLTGLCGNCNDDTDDDLAVDGRSVNSFPSQKDGYLALASRYLVEDDSDNPSQDPICHLT